MDSRRKCVSASYALRIPRVDDRAVEPANTLDTTSPAIASALAIGSHCLGCGTREKGRENEKKRLHIEHTLEY